jgi:hypothetical protein
LRPGQLAWLEQLALVQEPGVSCDRGSVHHQLAWLVQRQSHQRLEWLLEQHPCPWGSWESLYSWGHPYPFLPSSVVYDDEQLVLVLVLH